MNNEEIKLQTPLQAWISLFALMGIDETLKTNPNISLEAYIEQQKKKTNIWANNPDAPIYGNIGTVMMMSYIFLLVPKEILKDKKMIIESLEINSLLSKMKIIKNEKLKNLDETENIIRHIRNSIAHTHFELLENGTIIKFIDKSDRKINFDGRIKINDFKEFVQAYFKEYFQKVLPILTKSKC